MEVDDDLEQDPGHDHSRELGFGLLLRLGSAIAFVTYVMLFKLANQQGGSGALEMLFFRAAFAIPLVLIWTGWRSGFSALVPKAPLSHLGRSALGIVAILFTYESFILLPLALAVTISFTAPIFATLLSAVILRERVALYHWLALGTGFAGIVIASNPGETEVSSLGVAVAIISAILQGVVTITLRHLGRTETVESIVFWFLMGSLLVGSVAMPILGRWPDREVLVFLVGGGLVSAGMQLMMTASLQRAPVALLSSIDYTQIVWAALLGYLVLGSPPEIATLLGSAFVIASGIQVMWLDRRARRRAEALSPP